MSESRVDKIRKVLRKSRPVRRLGGMMGIELDRTVTNSNKPKNGGNDRQKPMNYGEWSKSNKLEQTLTPNSRQRDDSRTDEKIFEQKVRKVTKGRESQVTFGRGAGSGNHSHNWHVGRTRSNCVELEQTRTHRKTGEMIAKSL